MLPYSTLDYTAEYLGYKAAKPLLERSLAPKLLPSHRFYEVVHNRADVTSASLRPLLYSPRRTLMQLHKFV